MTCAAERAIQSSAYATKLVWEIISAAPTYSSADLTIVAGFLKWANERLAPTHTGDFYSMLAINLGLADLGQLNALQKREGASPRYQEQWKEFYEKHIRKVLSWDKTRDLLKSDFLAVYQHLKAVPSVEGLDIRTCAIVWKGFYQGWENLDGWQKLVVFDQAYFPLKRHMDRMYPAAHSLARDVHFPGRREEGSSRSAAVWQDETRRKWA
ncbi:hypothetical protein BCR35DRAFT_332723 [Leucosporidium creatinivorum]|uniref:Uncharacterized protein n=1 Tax=Leucosporidium creatinivorum TaxID=106004 RepID=A0A1Y2F087_9BASI|nr:hypothetical protein BCR35DRAFT_332723 [Leucosporidium creatinivorum]